MFESLSEISGRSGSGPSAFKNITFQYYHHPSEKRAKVKIRIPSEIAKKANINVGDRIDFLVDRLENIVMIKKLHDDKKGWKLGRHKTEFTMSTQYTIFEGCLMPCAGKKSSIVLRPKTQDGAITFNMPDSLRFYTE